MKYLILSCLAAVAIVSMVGCACDEKRTEYTTETSTTTYDPKAMR